ncbi:MAG: hypothetical protein VKP62_15515 [Candidatus Sericytochromatia bacterium]|nr:hypothetical protein [Candidatus Sericytochromatia bacterium]
MSSLNHRLESQLKSVGQDPTLRPALAQVIKVKQTPGVTSVRVYEAALDAARDTFAVSTPHPDLVRERALLIASAAAAETSVSLADLPAGADKSRHCFLSAYMSLKLARIADGVLPRALAERVGVWGSMGIGLLKELYDMVFATGFSRADLVADLAGARLPFQAPRLG